MKYLLITLSFLVSFTTITAQDPCENVRLYFPQLGVNETTTIPVLEVGSLRELSLLGAEKCVKDADYDLRGYSVLVNGKTLKSVKGYEDRFFPKIYMELEKLKAGDKFTVTAKVSMRIDGEFHKYLTVKRVFNVSEY